MCAKKSKIDQRAILLILLHSNHQQFQEEQNLRQNQLIHQELHRLLGQYSIILIDLLGQRKIKAYHKNDFLKSLCKIQIYYNYFARNHKMTHLESYHNTNYHLSSL